MSLQQLKLYSVMAYNSAPMLANIRQFKTFYIGKETRSQHWKWKGLLSAGLNQRVQNTKIKIRTHLLFKWVCFYVYYFLE